MIDPKITVDATTGKQIAQIICKEVKESLDKNKKIYDRAIRNENQYAQRTKWDVKGVECNVPWEGASNYFVGLSEWIVDAIWSRLMNILFGQPDYMVAKGVESSDIEKQDAVTDFMRVILKEKIKLYENSNLFFKQLIKLPFAVLKFCWVQEYDSMIVKESGVIYTHPETGDTQNVLLSDPDMESISQKLLVSGYQAGEQQDFWVAQDVELINSPKLQYINFQDYVYSPTAKRGNRLFWEGDRFWLTINEMMLKANQDKFIKDTVDKVRTSRKDATKSGVDAIIADRESLIECFHWYGRLPFNKNNDIDFQDPEAIEQEVYCVVSFKDEELLEINRWYYRRKPFPDRVYIRECYEETEQFDGRSVLDKLFKTQGELNDFHKTLMDNAWLSMQKIFVKKRSLVGEDWEEPSVYPGAFLEVEQAGDIDVLSVGDVKAIGMELESLLLNYAERLSNINNWNLGTQKVSGGKATATEFAGVIQEGNIGREPLLQRCYIVLKKICQWTYDYYYERMPEGLERRILGDNGEEIFPTQQNMSLFAKKGINPTWKQDDIAGQFDFEWLGTSQNENKQWNLVVANDLQDRYLKFPMVAGNMLATWEILKEGLVSRGRRDLVAKLLPKKEAIMAEMQRMQQESMMAQQVNSKLGVEGIADPKMKEMVMSKLKDKLQNAGSQGELNGVGNGMV